MGEQLGGTGDGVRSQPPLLMMYGNRPITELCSCAVLPFSLQSDVC